MIRGMSFVHRLAVCLACLVVFVPRFVPALELGPIETRSALYEPLDARIPVQGARSGDLKGLNVVLGSPAQFELAGVARLQHLNMLEFVVVEQGAGYGYIHVRTGEPIIEPSLTFLIDVDWPRGRTVRGYRLHLTPAAGPGVAPGRSGSAAPQEQSVPDTGTSASTPGSSGMEYGPVRKAETLWSIAARLRPDHSVSVQRMMLAILEANPSAFEFGNVNALNAGAKLRIPTRDEIGPDDLRAAIAEVERHHSAWTTYRKEGRAAPTPSAPTPEAAPRDTDTEPSSRVEVVSPESTTTPSREEGAQVATLRKELVLAMEEVDAGRRENDELKLRLAEAEDHIEELNRLVDLKNEEIVALQSELQELVRTAPQAVAGPEEAGPEPVAAAEGEEARPAPTEAEPKPVKAAAESKSLPFGLGSLPVNPVFLVGGAGLLLILLGVVALLRRRRASAGEDDVLEAAESSSPDEDNLLLELEAVAAELADEPDDSPARPSRAAPAAAGAEAGKKPEAEDRGAAGSVPEDVEDRIAELWRDDRAVERGEMFEADDDSSDISFDVDALTGDDSDLKSGRESRDLEADIAGAPAETVDVESVVAADRSVDDVSILDDDAVGPVRAPQDLLDESTGRGEEEPFSLEEFGEDEVQTKIDLAQVYMEMGDTESARGFLEAVLAEGDAEQQETARKMLSELG